MRLTRAGIGLWLMLAGLAGCEGGEPGAAVTDTGPAEPLTAASPGVSPESPQVSAETRAVSASTTLPAAEEPLVDLASVAPQVVIDVRYATENNFMRKRLYPAARVLLRESVARRLARVQEELAGMGLGLKVFDGYRPLSVQRQMWAMLPDPNYVADPAKGSRHNRGAAVDVTLVDAEGRELEMPSAYDEFSASAHVDYAGGSEAARKNRDLLVRIMHKHGFTVLKTEWWHFDAPGWRNYSVLDIPLDAVTSGPAGR